jgi:retinol-binding protein 3
MKKSLGLNLLLLACTGLFAQEAVLIDAKTKKEVVTKVAQLMKEKYVFADIGEKMAKYIQQQQKKRTYDSYSELKPFCAKLTSDLREISNDKHLFVFYSPEEAYQVKAYNKMLPEEEIKKVKERDYEIDKKGNFGFKKVEILDGNIGYLEIKYCSDTDILEEALNGAMKFLSNSDAIIIDMRDNGGGEMSSLLQSYFLPAKKILLGSANCRDASQNKQSWSMPDIPGKHLLDIELYILTNSKTFSAAEGFTYTMQKLKRAVVVGETTKGGAHPIDVFIVKGDILTQIAICESCNPITKSNWEGTGVKPDIEAKSEDALHVAQVTALEHILKKTTDPEYKDEIKLLLTKLKNNPSKTAE